MRLSSVLSGKAVALPIPINDDVLTVTYLPDKLTPELEDIYASDFETQRNGGGLAKYVLGILDSWDLKDDDGNDLPLTIESFSTLPIKFIGAISTAISEDMNPEKKTGGSLAGTSRRGAR